MLKKISSLLITLVCLSAVAMTTQVFASSAPAPAPGSNSEFPYVELSPSFVTNYDGGGRLRYLKVDVTVRTKRPANVAVQHHLPYIRNQLIKLFASQLEENLTSTDGKEHLREEALEEVRAAIDLLEGTGSADILELFFTSYVIQQ
ncbi:MAG: flagellar basal body-associated FliL family protein [Gammaproteobacteria bacterium]